MLHEPLFDDSRDCAKFLMTDLQSELTLQESDWKVIRRLTKESRPLSAPDELQALTKLTRILSQEAFGTEVPILVVAAFCSVAEMQIQLADTLADGALTQILAEVESIVPADNASADSSPEEDDPVARLEDLYDELMSAKLLELLVSLGMIQVAAAIKANVINIDWVREMGERVLFDEPVLGFLPENTRVLSHGEDIALVAITEGLEEGPTVSRYIVVTKAVPSDDPGEEMESIGRMYACAAADFAQQTNDKEEIGLGPPEFLTVEKELSLPGILTKVAERLWATPPDVVVVVVCEEVSQVADIVDVLQTGFHTPAGLDMPEGPTTLH